MENMFEYWDQMSRIVHRVMSSQKKTVTCSVTSYEILLAVTICDILFLIGLSIVGVLVLHALAAPLLLLPLMVIINDVVLPRAVAGLLQHPTDAGHQLK